VCIPRHVLSMEVNGIYARKYQIIRQGQQMTLPLRY
jgi:hypothetical protein